MSTVAARFDEGDEVILVKRMKTNARRRPAGHRRADPLTLWDISTKRALPIIGSEFINTDSTIIYSANISAGCTLASVHAFSTGLHYDAIALGPSVAKSWNPVRLLAAMQIGVDFGSFSSRAAWVTHGVVQYIAPAYDVTSVPTSVYCSHNGDLLTGQEAEDRALADPSRLCRDFKLDLGSRQPYLIAGRELHPRMLATAILRKIRELAVLQAVPRQYPDATVIAAPAGYETEPRKWATLRQIAETAEFLNVQVLSEPIAAALHYDAFGPSSGLHEGDIVLVYDLGWSAFTASLLLKRATGFELLAVPLTTENVGGSHFDFLIFDDLRKHSQGSIPGDECDESLSSFRDRFWIAEQCRSLKHKLSAADSAYINLPQTSVKAYTLTRTEFEHLITPTLEETAELSRKLMEGEGLKITGITGLLPIGGSARIPFVRHFLGKHFHRPIMSAGDPAMAVCSGAALRASQHRLNTAAAERREPYRGQYRVYDDVWSTFGDHPEESAE